MYNSNNLIVQNNTPRVKNSFIRVSKNKPCPICNKPDWCLVSPDGKAAICARIESQNKAGNAGWLHNLNNALPVIKPQIKLVKQSKKASIEKLNTAYRFLFSALTLSDNHKENLLKRGILEDQLTRYRTIPQHGREDIIRLFHRHNIQLGGIPGFYTDSAGKWCLSGADGICIPVMDLQGRISGIQIRRDGDVKPKYVWLSSKYKLNGCSSGVSIHVANPGNTDSKAIWITEGPLKADIISLKLNRIVLAIPGVSNWTGVIPILQQLKPISVIVALDMDKFTNQTVMTYRKLLINRLLRTNMKILEANWNSDFKGIDDFICRGL